MVESFWFDVKHASRSLVRTPGFAMAAVLTLALGTGANTAIFSVVNGVLLRPLPYPEPERLVAVWNSWDDTPRGGLSPAEYFDYLDRVDAFEHLGVYTTDFAALTGSGEPERVPAGYLSFGVLSALGVQPQVGRIFSAADDVPDADVVILSDGLWQRRFGRAADIVGRRIVIDGAARTVIGVLPPGFRLPVDFDDVDPAQVFAPLGLDRQNLPGRGSHFLAAVARLRPGVTPQQASARIAAVAERFADEIPAQYPAALRFTALTVSLHEDVVGEVKTILLTLLAAIAFVLLIACGNITHLFLSRAERRRGEYAIRMALGAGRSRLLRQTLAESMLVAVTGGAAGLVLAAAGTQALLAMSPPDLPRLDAVTLDVRVLAFGLGASILVGIIVGTIPALRTAHALRDAAAADDGRGVAGASPSRQRLRRVLIGSEVAIAIVLTLGAGLMVKSFLRMLSIDPGYRTEGILTASVTLPAATYPDAGRTAAFFAGLVERLRRQSGVIEAGAVAGLPLTNPRGDLNFQIEGRETAPGQRSRRADWQVVTPGYFEAIGMRLLEGRGIETADRTGSPGVVVLNEAAARLHWPDGNALGARMRLGGNAGPGWVTVVGIVNDVRHGTLRDQPNPEMYLAHAQFRFWGTGTEPVRALTLVVRTDRDPVLFSDTVRREVAALDPALPVDAIRSMDAVRSASVSSHRFVSVLLSIFAALALTVTLVGVYGVMAYSVVQRRREIGVRVALGAHSTSVLVLVLKQGLTPAAIGIGVGLVGGIALSGVLRAQLYEVTPYDAVTALIVSGIVALVALLACLVPAARAAAVNPVEALRAQ
jgi:putative ABC transport system permease protein